jgi:hypothetical protein
VSDSKIVSLADARADRSPHLSGRAECIGCRHSWEAVAPLGTVQLECPACGLPKGAWACEVVRDDQVWECNCGGQLFRIAKHCGPYCANCGTEATGWFD